MRDGHVAKMDGPTDERWADKSEGHGGRWPEEAGEGGEKREGGGQARTGTSAGRSCWATNGEEASRTEEKEWGGEGDSP